MSIGGSPIELMPLWELIIIRTKNFGRRSRSDQADRKNESKVYLIFYEIFLTQIKKDNESMVILQTIQMKLE